VTLVLVPLGISNARVCRISNFKLGCLRFAICNL
jgi:hypothetical protein